MKLVRKLDPRLHLVIPMLGLFAGCLLLGLSVGSASAVTALGLVTSLVMGYLAWRAQVLRDRTWLSQAESTVREFEKTLAGLPPGSPRHSALTEGLERSRKELDAARERLYRRQPYLPDFLQV